MTDNYLVIPETPWVTCDTSQIFSKVILQGIGMMDTWYWDEGAMLEFNVVRKSDGQRHPVRYVADPGNAIWDHPA